MIGPLFAVIKSMSKEIMNQTNEQLEKRGVSLTTLTNGALFNEMIEKDSSNKPKTTNTETIELQPRSSSLSSSSSRLSERRAFSTKDE